MFGVATNVTAGKPKTSGAVFTGPITALMPTSATEALAAAFGDMGFLSEDGYSKNVSISTSTIKEWGGQVVMVTQDEKSATFKFKMIEYLRKEVQQFVNGSANVTGTPETGMKVTVNGDEAEERALVIDQVFRGGIPHRLVVPCCKITEMAEVVYKMNEAVGYEVTVAATKDASGNYFHEYFGPPVSGATGATGATGA